MKKIIIEFLATVVFAILPLFMLGQPNPGENPNGDPVSGDPIGEGGSAPVGGGVILLISMSTGYGLKKVFDASNKFEE
jgi:hypothetical protein